jgi:hypothetical protein
MGSTERNQLVGATRHAPAEPRRVVLVTGTHLIDCIFAGSGLDKALEPTANPATLDY